MIDIVKEAAAYQVELFQMIGEFWGRATGMLPEEFSSTEGFGDAIRQRARGLQYRAEDAFTFADTQLRTFYARNGARAYRLASRLAGTKLVLGGASNFGTSHLASTRSTLLYADTVLNGIIERLSPQFHLFENAEELTAHPPPQHRAAGPLF